MLNCDDYEMLAERAQRDALTPEERDVLERHLAECDGCREFAELASSIGGALRQRAGSAGPAPGVAGLRAGFIARLHRRRRDTAIGIAGAAAVIALHSWAYGTEYVGIMIGVLVIGLVVVVFRFQLPRRRRELAALAPDGDLLGTYRTDVELDIKGFRSARSLLPAYFIVGALALAIQPVLLVKQYLFSEELSWRGAIWSFLIFGSLGYKLWRDSYVNLPRLERELDELRS